MAGEKTQTKKTTEKKVLRLGIIGAGAYVAAAHMPALHRLSGVEVVAVTRKHPERLKKFCEKYKIPKGYTDYKKMLAQEKLDGVIIASPHALHYEHAMACLKKGIPILLEKPMAVKASEAREIYEYATRHNIPVVVGYNRHYWSNFCYARKVIEENELGPIKSISARWPADIEWSLTRQEPPLAFQQLSFYSPGDEPNFRGDPALAGGGMFIDGGSNMLDAILWLTRLKPLQIFAFMDNRGFQTDCDTVVSIKFDNDVLCSCIVLGAAKAFKEHQLFIYGEKGAIYVDDHTIFYQFNGEKEVEVVDLPADSCSTANFVHALQGKERVHCTAADGLRVAIAVEAVYNSARSHKPEVIKEWV